MLTPEQMQGVEEYIRTNIGNAEDAAAMITIVHLADEVTLDLAGDEGGYEWIVLKFQGKEYAWNFDDDWDADLSPMLDVVHRLGFAGAQDSVVRFAQEAQHERDEERAACDYWSTQAHNAEQIIAEYAWHKRSCPAGLPSPGNCSCGYTARLRQYDAEKERGRQP